MWFWIIGVAVLVVLGSVFGVPSVNGKMVFIPIAGIAQGLVAAIPGIIGVLGSLFGKKKPKETQYAAQMDPVALKYRNQLLQMMGSRMGQPTQAQGVGNDVLAAMYKQYFNRPSGQ
jgi:hypothetical protein